MMMRRSSFYIQADTVGEQRKELVRELKAVCQKHGAKLASLKGLSISDEFTNPLLHPKHTTKRHAKVLYGFDRKKVFLM